MKFLSTVFLLLIVTFGSYAEVHQEDLEKMRPRRKIRTADYLFERGSYFNAIEYYQSAQTDKPTDPYLAHQIAESNRLLRDYEAAIKAYEQTLELDKRNKYPHSRFYYAEMLKRMGRCDEAITNFNQFITDYKGRDRDVEVEKARREIQGCEYAMEAVNNPERVLIEPLNEQINFPLTEYAPRPVGTDTLLFASLRSDTAIAVNKQEGDYFSKIYISVREDGVWREPFEFPGPINSTEAHTGNPTMSADRQRIYFTRCVQDGEKLQDWSCDIYMSRLQGGTWQTPVRLPDGVNGGKMNTHPSVTTLSDGREVLYYSRDNTEEGTGLDIYYAVRSAGGEFGAGTPLTAINTDEDDVTPNYHAATNTLYFSSRGRVGMGGFDVYKATGSEGNLTNIENVGFPVSTQYDDIYLAVDDEGGRGFLISNRPSGGQSIKAYSCCDDIFGFKFIREIVLKSYATAADDADRKPLDGVDVSLYTLQGDTLTFQQNLTSGPDELFMFNLDPKYDYVVTLKKPGFENYTDSIKMADVGANVDTIFRVYQMTRLAVAGIQLRRVFFQFNRSNIQTKYQERLDSIHVLMRNNPTYLLEIIGHTDAIGSEAYNMALGERRAKAAQRYLVRKGIKADRIVTSSKGESEPVAINVNADGSDNPEGRAQNRRVEYRIYTTDDEIIEIVYPDVPDLD